MSKVIRTIIDEKGDIVTDMSGFNGEECVAEEERLRKELSQYGVILHREQLQRKATSNNAHVSVSIKNS